MMMTTVVAVALGLAPVKDDSPAQLVSGDYSAAIGPFSQTVDQRGTTRIRGRASNGASYELMLDKHGYVEATVGDHVVQFRVQDAG